MEDDLEDVGLLEPAVNRKIDEIIEVVGSAMNKQKNKFRESKLGSRHHAEDFLQPLTGAGIGKQNPGTHAVPG